METLEYKVRFNYSLTDSNSLKISVGEKKTLTFQKPWTILNFLRPSDSLRIQISERNENSFSDGEEDFSIFSVSVSRGFEVFNFDSTATLTRPQSPPPSSSLTPLTSVSNLQTTASVGGAYFATLPPGAGKYVDNYKGDYFSSNILLADDSFLNIPISDIRQCSHGLPQFSLQLWSQGESILDLPWIQAGQIVRAINIAPKIDNRNCSRWNLYFRQRQTNGSKIEIFDNDKAPKDLVKTAEWARREISGKSLIGDFGGDLSNLTEFGVDLVVRVVEVLAVEERSLTVEDLVTTEKFVMKEGLDSYFVLNKVKTGDWLLCRNVRRVGDLVFVSPHYITPLPEWSFDVKRVFEKSKDAKKIYFESQPLFVTKDVENFKLSNEKWTVVEESQDFLTQQFVSPEAKKMRK